MRTATRTKNLCIAYCSSMLGQCSVPAREKKALKTLMPALNKEPSGCSGALSSEQTATWPDPLGKLRVKIFIIFIMLSICNAKYFAK